MARQLNRHEQADYRQLMLWADVYRAVGGHSAGWQPPALVTDRDHPFPRQMAPVRTRWRDRIGQRLRTWLTRADDEGATR